MIVPDFLVEAINRGVEVTMRHHADYGIGFDVNTRAKSDVVIYQSGSVWIAHLRYNETKLIEDFRDLAVAVKHAMHGRDYVDDTWLEILLELGFVKKTVTTNTVITYA